MKTKQEPCLFYSKPKSGRVKFYFSGKLSEVEENLKDFLSSDECTEQLFYQSLLIDDNLLVPVTNNGRGGTLSSMPIAGNVKGEQKKVKILAGDYEDDENELFNTYYN